MSVALLLQWDVIKYAISVIKNLTYSMIFFSIPFEFSWADKWLALEDCNVSALITWINNCLLWISSVYMGESNTLLLDFSYWIVMPKCLCHKTSYRWLRFYFDVFHILDVLKWCRWELMIGIWSQTRSSYDRLQKLSTCIYIQGHKNSNDSLTIIAIFMSLNIYIHVDNFCKSHKIFISFIWFWETGGTGLRELLTLCWKAVYIPFMYCFMVIIHMVI